MPRKSAKPLPQSPARRNRVPLVAALLAAAAVLFILISRQTSSRAAEVPWYGYRVVRVYPHDTSAFTQGLEFRGGYLYEGTGLEGRSQLRKLDLETGAVLQQASLDPMYFGEGITVVGRQLVQLTWQSQLGFLYRLDDFQLLRTFTYTGEGWGLANDGKRIFMSDGSSRIRVWDPVTFEEQTRFSVVDGLLPVSNLNELEYVRGELFANIWQSDRVVRFSPQDGSVLGWIDLSGLLAPDERASGVDVLNGIAYDAEHNRLFVTGKFWPKLFEIELVPLRR